jgi:hypothetical protein
VKGKLVVTCNTTGDNGCLLCTDDATREGLVGCSWGVAFYVSQCTPHQHRTSAPRAPTRTSIVPLCPLATRYTVYSR